MQNRTPLGFIDLKGGQKPIYAFNDFFLILFGFSIPFHLRAKHSKNLYF